MATSGQLQMYNKLEVAEMFELGEKARDPRDKKIRRIQIYHDEKVPDACVFKIWLEDHTLGNILRMELLRNENVVFVGYKVPHPLDHMIELRLQTLPKSSPEIALRRAIANLRTECKSMLDQFDVGVASLRSQERLMDVSGGNDDQTSRAGESVPDDEQARRFDEQLEELGRVGDASSSFSPLYSPSGPGAEG
mmetsp:Transcript_71011/g.154339  ORF Transcript_71011/g.154339 Transcript_71011/m.154339 type:complete len:193 (-) Transcript_71011:123-701(-)|eukprot:CAMPEP_0170578384 /NCGR_PEP_ID=MMETSP0224-20130122/5426_1 /TAXON_ID=285029 /ORGANISM="Togula jolla, Strain CCCM 725" /LENGTH=192 /DNA_ID=CAMNT_0010901347 /DNA_START=83 /DNA_END=661 /DNA_ORIENTATION=-